MQARKLHLLEVVTQCSIYELGLCMLQPSLAHLAPSPEGHASQAGSSANGIPAPVKVFGKGSKAAPAFGLAALSSPRTPPAQPTPATPSATAQIGAAAGVSAPPGNAAPGSAAIAASVASGAAAVLETSVPGKRQRESEDG